MFQRSIFVVFILLGISPTLFAIEARLRVGVVRPKTGPMSPVGEELMRGIRIAYAKALSTKGINKDMIQIIEVDDQGRSSEAAKVTESLISQRKVHLIIGSVSNTVNHSIADIASRKNRIVILPVGTDPDLIAKGKGVFTVSLNEEQQGKALGKFAATKLKKSNAVIFSELENPYSESLSKTFAKSFTDRGGEIETISYSTLEDIKQKSLSPYANQAIFIPGFYFEARQIISAFKKQGVNATFLGGDGWDTANIQQVFGPQFSGHYFYSPYSVNDPHPAMKKFLSSYRAQYRKQPSFAAFAGYEAFNLAMFAYRKVKSNRTAPLQKFLTRAKKLPGLMGPFRMNSSRSPNKPATIMVTTTQGAQYMTKVSP